MKSVFAAFFIGASILPSARSPAATSTSANVTGEIQEILSRTTPLTEEDFKTLTVLGSRQHADFGLRCQTSISSQEPEIPDVFGDAGFGQRFATDPVYQKIKTYIYFNEAAGVVPDAFLEDFTRFAKAFFTLYKDGLIRSPDLSRLDPNAASDLTQLAIDGHPLEIGHATNADDIEAVQILMNHDETYGKDGSLISKFSAAMVLMMAKIAQSGSRCDMTAVESTALEIYEGMGFNTLNPYLRRHGADNARLNLLEKMTNRALDKIANSERLVFRTTTFMRAPDMPESIYRSHTQGSKVVYDAFTSTSSAQMSMANFLIYSRTGKSLGPLSVEHEVLFKSHTSFKVRFNSCEAERLPVWQGCDVILEEVPGTDLN